MRSEDWKTVKDLLPEVSSLDTAARQKFLDERRVSEDIRAELESLLLVREEAADFMSVPASDFAGDFFPERSHLHQQIGIYRIIRELGHGGMGAVYLAERSDGKFEQKVALKLLKREMNTAALRRRFQKEREILASLEHPNIARLLDAGTTGDQIPYLAMEYVEGLPIDEYCNKHNLDLNERLDLFRKVCAAVNFAHRNLVVHRDLKPSNILVTEDGVPKLLDFGISKILAEGLEGGLKTATVTKYGVMTPAYASPEQLRGKSVTTATDIYSLGVILYELLSGHRPFETKEEEFNEIFRAVLEDEPLPPSAASRRDTETHPRRGDADKKTEGTGIATASSRLRVTASHLKGDLDNIVLKALRKEPERRYSSAENLAADIERHQEGLPVTARPNTFSYRASKFIRRNQVGVFAFLLIFLAILSGVAATLWQARVARAERAKAERRFNDVRALANSFLFEFSPKIENLPGSMPARELLVRRALEYLDNLSREAGDDSELQKELATAYEKVGDLQGNPFNRNIGDVKGAVESFEKAQVIRQKLLEKNPDDERMMDALANNFKLQGSLHSQGGNFGKAGKLYEEALVLQTKAVEKKPQDFTFRWNLADITRYNGFINYTNEQHKIAAKYYLESIGIYEQLVREQPENYRLAEMYANVYVSLGESQGWDGDLVSAGTNLQKGLEMLIPLKEKYPNDRQLQRSLVVAYGKRGENYVDVEDYEKAIEVYEKSIALAEDSLQSDPLDKQSKRDLGIQNKRLAAALNSVGKTDESIEKMNLAINIFKDLAKADPHNTENYYDIANVRGILSNIYLSAEQYEKALETCSKAKEEYEIALKLNPEKDYIKAGLAFAFMSAGKSYLGLAKHNQLENLQKSLQNFRLALDGFNSLKNAGRLSQFDLPNIEKIEKEIEKIESKINQNASKL